MISLVGRWRIVETELWDREDLDLVGPAFVEFGKDKTGRRPGISTASTTVLQCADSESVGEALNG